MPSVALTLFFGLIGTAMTARTTIRRSDEVGVDAEDSMGNGTLGWGRRRSGGGIWRRRRSVPAPGPPSPAPAPPDTDSFCGTAACCKTKANVTEDGKMCDEFYDRNVGIAWQMVRTDKWEWFAELKPELGHSPFHEHFSLTRDENLYHQQCVSISHSGKTPCPYPGSDSSWGMVMSVGPTSDFWQYFEQCSGGALTAQCHDGYKCARNTRTPISAAGWNYEAFVRAKNSIIEQTGTPRCPLNTWHPYNEFDTNGLSTSAVAGVFIPECLQTRKKPEVWAVCAALNKINPEKKNWPVFAYRYVGDSSSLILQSYLSC